MTPTPAARATSGGYRGTPEFSATERRLRGYGKPAQTIDANITEDGGPVRYYAKLPKKAESPEAWLQSLGRAPAENEPVKLN